MATQLKDIKYTSGRSCSIPRVFVGNPTKIDDLRTAGFSVHYDGAHPRVFLRLYPANGSNDMAVDLQAAHDWAVALAEACVRAGAHKEGFRAK